MSTPALSNGLNQVSRIARLCDFLEHPAIREALKAIPCSMPQTLGAFGFEESLWMGFGVVGVWAALDAYAERACLANSTCSVCTRARCLVSRFTQTGKVSTQLLNAIAEVEDLRHLFAHNFAGEADAEYFGRNRHVLKQNANVRLSSGGHFDGRWVALQTAHLRYYATCAADVLKALG